MTTSKKGRWFKVALGADKVAGVGQVSINGQAVEMLDDTEFGQNVKMFVTGLRDGGQVAIQGLYKPADTNGQNVLRQAFVNELDITNLRVYIDSTSYFEPCQTSGYHSPASTTGNNTVLSYVNVMSHEMSGDKGQLGTWSATFKVSGDMVLV